jgi:hypothetical protein
VTIIQNNEIQQEFTLTIKRAHEWLPLGQKLTGRSIRGLFGIVLDQERIPEG